MIKELGQILEDAREELDDEVAPYLWSDPVLTKRANEAVYEAALRTRCMVETERDDICQIQLVAGQASYDLHPSIVVIRRAVLASDRSEPLCRTTTAALDGHCSSWATETGKPEFLVRDGQSRRLTVSPIPTEDEILYLTVWRTPTDDELMEDESDTPAIDPLFHDNLWHWVVFRALTRRDTEQANTKDADRHLAEFETAYGPRPTAAQLQALAIDPITGTEPMFF